MTTKRAVVSLDRESGENVGMTGRFGAGEGEATPPRGGAVDKNRQSLLRGVVHYGLGSFVPQIVSFLLVPVYSHYLSPAEFGIVEICVTAQGLMGIVIRLGMTGSVARLYFDYGESSDLSDYVTTVAISVLAVAAMVTALVVAAGPRIAAALVPGIPFMPYFALALAGAVVQGPTDIQRRLLEARQESGYAARLTAAFGSVTIVATLVAVIVLRAGAAGILWVNLGSGGVFSVLAAWRHRGDLTGRFRVRHLQAALGYGLPLVPHHASAWANQFIGRWVLATTTTAASVGQLGIASRVVAPLAMAIGAFATDYSPRYFSQRASADHVAAHREAMATFRLVATLGAVAVSGAATFGVFAVLHLLAASYSSAAPVVPLVATAAFCQLIYTAIAVELFFAKRTKWVSLIFMAASAANVGAMLAFPGRVSAEVAGAAQVVGGIVAVGMVCWIAGRGFPLPLERRSLAVCVCIPAVAILGPRELWTGSTRADFVVACVAFMLLSAATVSLAGTGQAILAALKRRPARNSKEA